MDVSIIIVNYNTSHLIKNCIDSIIKLTEIIEYEIIVVDNATEPDLEEKLLFSDKVKVVKLDRNLGFGLANNEGFKYATGKYVLCLNPDTLLINNAIWTLFNSLESNSQIGICGGNLYDELNKPALSFKRMLPGILNELNELFFEIPQRVLTKNRYFNYSEKIINVGYISGADLMIRYDVFKKMNGFSSSFFMYYEETDLCARVMRDGYGIISVPQAKIQHLEGKSFNTSIKYNQLRFTQQSRHKYLCRNVSFLEKVLCDIVYSISCLINILISSVKGKVQFCSSILKLIYFLKYIQYSI